MVDLLNLDNSLDDEVFAKKVCRTCSSDLGNDSLHINTKYVFSLEPTEAVEYDIKTMLMCLTPLKFGDKDDLPTEICNYCLRRLTDSFSFRLMCIKSDSDFSKTLTKNSILSPSFNAVELLDISNDSIVHEFLNMKQKLNKYDDEEIYFNLFNDSNIIGIKETFVEVEENPSTKTISNELELNNKIIPLNDEIKSNTKSDIATTACHSNNSYVQLLNSENSESKKTKELKYVCDYCGKQFQRHKGLFKNHIARHANIKPYKCSHCQKVFHIRDDLMKHLLCHTSNNYVCHSCGASFSRKDSLKTHSKIHLGIKPNGCPHCPKRFLSAYNLKNHVRIHLNESPYTCSLCQKAFKQRSALVRHTKIHK